MLDLVTFSKAVLLKWEKKKKSRQLIKKSSPCIPLFSMQCRKASKFLIKWWLRNRIHMPLSCHEPCSALKRVLREQLVLQILILSGLNFSRVLRVWSFYSLHKMSGKIWLIDAFFQDFFSHYKLFAQGVNDSVIFISFLKNPYFLDFHCLWVLSTFMITPSWSCTLQ